MPRGSNGDQSCVHLVARVALAVDMPVSKDEADFVSVELIHQSAERLPHQQIGVEGQDVAVWILLEDIA